MKDILVIEDNPIDSIKIKVILNELGYSTINVVSNLKEAQTYIESKKPDLIIANIFLQGESGVEIASNKSIVSIPLLFITASKDKALYDSIPNRHLYGYLTKPIDPVTLYSTIKLLTYKHKSTNITSTSLFIKHGNKVYKIPYADILWLEAEGNYTFIHSLSGKQVIKKSLRRVAEGLDDRFAQCHKKYCVNLHYVSYVRSDAIRLNDQDIPMTFFYKKTFLSKLQSLKAANEWWLSAT